ncbi:MAG: ABC transporter permease subunit, partial [Candidatus Electrothrix sp. AX2]|nr:ABC transporter permease subunit [Candidatus Electrothrix gigas]
YVKAAKALGVGNLTIMYRHLLPNGMTPVITFLPFRISSAILSCEKPLPILAATTSPAWVTMIQPSDPWAFPSFSKSQSNIS